MAFTFLHLLSTIHFSAALAYSPFVNPMPIWDYWYVLILPLAAAVAVVYKAIKLDSMRDVPWQAFVITLWIVLGMVAAAVVLAAVVRVTEW
jgi:hypothetical protein